MKFSVRLIAFCLLFFALCIYLFTLAPDVLPGDSGEFQFAAPLLSIVHPTGYPLYLLVAKVVTFIPIGSIAYRVNLLSALCAALTIGFVYLVALHLASQLTNPPATQLLNQLATAVAALTLAFTPTFWSQATEAEVYALNSLFVITLIGLGVYARKQAKDGAREQGNPISLSAEAVPLHSSAWLWLALALGLALAHHRSIILLLPALAVYLFPFDGLRRVWKRVTLLLLLPLALYVYTPLRYDASPYTRIELDAQHVITTLPDTPTAFVAHALGTGFGGALRWDAATWVRLLATPERITAEFTLVGRVLITLGTLYVLWKREWRLFALLIGTAVCYIVFNAAYQIGDIADFYTPIYIVGALLIAQGVVGLSSISRIPYRLSRLLPIVLLALPLYLLVTNFAPTQQHDDALAHWQALLAANPATGAVVISNDRDEMTPLYYLQLVEGKRPDLFPLFPLISPDLPYVVPLTQYALETQRPVYFIKPMDGLDVKFRMQPQGELMRVLGLQDTRPAHALVRESSSINFVGWSQEEIANRQTQIAVVLFWQAQGATRPDITTFVHMVNRDGSKIAQSDHRPGGAFYPSSQWARGETLRDAHVIALPPNLAIGEYQIVAGAYLPDGRRIEGIGQVELGVVTLGE